MKVKTNLKSGNVLNDATHLVNSSVNQVSGFLSAANHQAQTLSHGAKNAVTSSWSWVADRWPF